MKQDLSQGNLYSVDQYNIPLPYALCLEKVDIVRRGPKEILETINTQLIFNTIHISKEMIMYNQLLKYMYYL